MVFPPRTIFILVVPDKFTIKDVSQEYTAAAEPRLSAHSWYYVKLEGDLPDLVPTIDGQPQDVYSAIGTLPQYLTQEETDAICLFTDNSFPAAKLSEMLFFERNRVCTWEPLQNIPNAFALNRP